jgi:putative addiction module killer protein
LPILFLVDDDFCVTTLHVNIITVVDYVQENGDCPFKVWFDSLDRHAATKIAAATVRLETGNTSGVKWIGVLGEYRIDSGPGYRIYLAKDGGGLIVLFGGGTKRRQQADVKKDAALVAEYRRRKKSEREKKAKGDGRALTRDCKATVADRASRDPAFAQALLDEAATAFLNGEPGVTRLILRDLVNATVGFEKLATVTDKPSKSLHRMLSKDGNPTMDDLAAIFGAVRRKLDVGMEARAVPAARQ